MSEYVLIAVATCAVLLGAQPRTHTRNSPAHHLTTARSVLLDSKHASALAKGGNMDLAEEVGAPPAWMEGPRVRLEATEVKVGW